MNLFFSKLDEVLSSVEATQATRHSARSEVLAWRCIETAPIDERILIAATPDWVSEGYVLNDTDSDDHGRDVRTYHWADGSTLHANLKPTHWMPLPKHPAKEQA